ncbi:regulator of G-protein signaling 18-like isoform X1 [Onychostruthus taczanowskii]|uniref:regulator of G-protein signaling 18-like isoform X1 n=1 Tax=Onychostruthus taczanowskii TaxID=356909 RepID=UPI001B806C43|nr:regulator of G-protein signaling 18-like isoform X1 [Onychostruthus taczanowskii]
MENPLLLFPQLNISASKDKPYYKVTKSTIKEEPHKASKPGAKQKRNRLSLLLQKPEFHESDHLGKPGNLTKAASSVSPEEAVKWGESFDKLLSEKAGLDAFTKFLKTEFSEENIEFWIACEDYKKSKSAQELLPKAKTIFETFIQKDAPKEVNLDFHTKEVTSQSMGQPLRSTFDAAQSTVYRLMEQDSYPRFLRSAPYLGLLQARPAARAPLRRRSRSFTVSDFQGVRPDLTVW